MQENRLARAEGQLTGRQRVLAWMHRQQQRGGYVDMAMESAESKGASGAVIELKDPDAAFVFYLALDCNMDVLKLQAAHAECALAWLCLSRFGETGGPLPEQWELDALRQLLKAFVLKWKLLEQVTAEVSNDYFDGLEVLWEDAETALIRGVVRAELLCREFNERVAARCGLNAISQDELQEHVREALSRELAFLVSIAWGKAEHEFGNRHSAYSHAADAIRLTDNQDAPNWIIPD